jgi:predicted nucleotidyltransferase
MKTLERIKGLSAEDRLLLQEVKAAILEPLPTADVLLYGSVARGTHDNESDYDILVLTDRSLTALEKDQVRDMVYEVQLAHETVITTLFYSRQDWDSPLSAFMPLHREVERDGIVL